MANERHAYFFPHPLRAADTPGRVPFAVEGTILGGHGAQTAAQFAIYADGYGKDFLGSNQDPCVFASPVPLLHAFCRLDAKGGKHYVENHGRRCLSQIVKPGDIVFYGSLITAQGQLKSIFFDTVMVVAMTCRWPTVRERAGGKPYRLLTDDASLADLGNAIGQQKPLRDTDAWRFCLRDSEHGHRFTAWDPHLIILGHAAAELPALRSLETSYVPVTPPDADFPVGFIRGDAPLKMFQQLASRYPRLCGSMKPSIPLDWSFATELYAAIASRSGPRPDAGLVAVPPLTPLRPRFRAADLSGARGASDRSSP